MSEKSNVFETILAGKIQRILMARLKPRRALVFVSEVDMCVGGISCDSGAKERGYRGCLILAARLSSLIGLIEEEMSK